MMQNYKNSGNYEWLALLNKVKKVIISLLLRVNRKVRAMFFWGVEASKCQPPLDFEPFSLIV